MPFIFHCPYCHSPMTVPDELAGTIATCAGCGRPITLPSAPVVPSGPTQAAPGTAPQLAAAPVPSKRRRRQLPALALVVVVVAVAGLVASGVALVRWGATRRPATTAPAASEARRGEGTPVAKGAGASATHPERAASQAETAATSGGEPGGSAGSVGTKYDGVWEVTSTWAKTTLSSFTVTDGEIRSRTWFASASDSPPTKPGTELGMACRYSTAEGVPISPGGKFAYGGELPTFEGVSTSDTEAKGTFRARDGNSTWTAKRK